ncbi:MAG: hypothetical protein ACRCY7_03150 [Cetobacterium sp.]|uniref:hypothetical protein n=1 Tax=Cetobacterium sp. TaxID=2071632 RepID=UPI003F3A5736
MITIPAEYFQAAHFIRSLKLAHGDVRNLTDNEISYIKERAEELKIKSVSEFINFIKENRNIKSFHDRQK